MQFTDEHVWIYGTVKKMDGNRLEIDDGTGTMVVDIQITGNDGESKPTVIKGKISAGAFVRVIGNVVTQTNKKFKLTSSIIQNLDELGVDTDLFTKIRSIEQKFAGDK